MHTLKFDGNTVYYEYWALVATFVVAFIVGIFMHYLVEKIKAKACPVEDTESQRQDDSRDVAGEHVSLLMDEKAGDDGDFIMQDLYEVAFNTHDNESVKAYHEELLPQIWAIPGLKELLHSHFIKIVDEKNGKMRFQFKLSAEEAIDHPVIKALLALLGNEERAKNIKSKGKDPKRMRVFGDDDKDEWQELVEVKFETSDNTNITNYHADLLLKIWSIPGLKDLLHDHEVVEIDKKRGGMQFVFKVSAEEAVDHPVIIALLALLRNDDRVNKLRTMEKDPEKKIKDDDGDFIMQDLFEVAFATHDNENVKAYHEQLLPQIWAIDGIRELWHSHFIKIVDEKNGKMRFQFKLSAEEAIDHPVIKALLALLKDEDKAKKIKSKGKEPKRMRVFGDDDKDEWQELVEVKFETSDNTNIKNYHADLLLKIWSIPGLKDLLHDHSVKVRNEKKGKMSFIFKISAEDAVDHPVIIALLALLRNDDRVNKLLTTEKDPEKKVKEFGDYVEEWENIDLIEVVFKTNDNESVKAYHEELLPAIWAIPGLKELLHSHLIEIVDEKNGKMAFEFKVSAEEAMDHLVIKALLALLGNEDKAKKIRVKGKDPKRMRRFTDYKLGDAFYWQELMEVKFKTSHEKNIVTYHDKLLAKIWKINGLITLLHDHTVKVRNEKKGKMSFIFKISAEDAVDHPVIIALLALLRNDDRVNKVHTLEKDPLGIKMKEFAEYDEDDIEWQDLTKLEFKTHDDDIHGYHKDLLQRIWNVKFFKELVHEHRVKVTDDKSGKMKFILKISGEDAINHPAVKAVLALVQNDDRVRKISMKEIDQMAFSRTSKMPMRSFVAASEYEEMMEVKFKTTGAEIAAYHEKLMAQIMAIKGFKKKKYHSHKAEVIHNNAGKIILLLKQNAATAIDDPIIKALLELLGNQDRVNKVKSRQKRKSVKEMRKFDTKLRGIKEFHYNEEDEYEEIMELVFNTNAENIEQYHQELMAEIMAVEGFEDKVHEKILNVIDEHNGTIQFSLKQKAENAFEDEAIRKVLFILKSADKHVHKIDVDKARPQNMDTSAPLRSKKLHKVRKKMRSFAMPKQSGNWVDLVTLEFDTASEVIEVYHEELLRRILSIKEFHEIMHDYNVDVLDAHRGKMTFTLKQNAEDAAKNPVIKQVIAMLSEEDERVQEVDVNTRGSMLIASKAPPVHKQPKLTRAVLISFLLKTEKSIAIKPHVDKLIAELETIPYFLYKMYEKQISVKKKNKAKFQLIMFCADLDNPMDDPEMELAMNVLKKHCSKEEVARIKSLKVETIPYFTES